MTYGGIEAGGTKFVCAVGNGPDSIRAVERFPTTAPEETLARTVEFFKAEGKGLAAVGIGSFGPVDPDPSSPTFGYITSTPKAGWQDTDFAGAIQHALDVPVAFDTDVHAAAMGEHNWGAAQDVNTFLYVTVGTGIGGGVIVDSRRVHGLMHPEIGHVFVPRAPGDDFDGNCPFHGACVEGMASGPALEARWQMPPASLPPDHTAWEMESHYLGYLLVNCICTFSPERIILGGGVTKQERLIPMIRRFVRDRLNDYIKVSALRTGLDSYIVRPALGDRAGVLGAIAMARERTSDAATSI